MRKYYYAHTHPGGIAGVCLTGNHNRELSRPESDYMPNELWNKLKETPVGEWAEYHENGINHYAAINPAAWPDGETI